MASVVSEILVDSGETEQLVKESPELLPVCALPRFMAA